MTKEELQKRLKDLLISNISDSGMSFESTIPGSLRPGPIQTPLRQKKSKIGK